MAASLLTPGYTWSDGEVVTATKLNATANPVVTSSASIGFASGSVSAPSFYYGVDTDTGFYRVGADNVAAAAGGVQAWNATASVFTFGYSSGVTVTSTGIQGPIGATTASTGSFTSIATTIAAGGAAAIFNASTGTAGTGMFVRLQRGGTNTWDVGTGISLGSDIFEIYNRTTSATAIQISASTNAVAITGALTTNGGLQTFGAADSAGAGFRLVRVPN